MSCPYFYPVEPRVGESNPRSALLPLGDCWTGVCHSVPQEPFSPDDTALRTLCRFGYARGNCSRFSEADPGADAVRFSLVQDEPASLHVYYVLERDHHPFAQGPLLYSPAAGAFTAAPPGDTLRRQAEAYVASYLKWKERAL